MLGFGRLAMWLALVLATPCGMGSAQAQGGGEPATAVIVFDGSGSMWGRPDGERQTRLVMARDAIRQGFPRITQGSRLGLMSFGHRRGGDCQDTELILKPEPHDVDAFLEPLERLNPKGRGPITKALREAAGVLGPQSAPASVILIHDGADNCQLDPCSALGDLRAAHPRVRVHVISIGLSADDAKTVACLPQSTGGKHHLVATAQEVAGAIGEAMAAIGQGGGGPAAAVASAASAGPAPKAAPRAEAPAATQRPGLQLWATLVAGGPVVSAPVAWSVRKAGETGPALWEGRTAAPLLVLPTGKYDIEARLGLVTRKVTADAVDGQARSLAVVLEAGSILLGAGQGDAGSPLEGAIVTLSRVEAKGPGEPRFLREAEAVIAVPPGTWLVAVTSGQLRIERPVGVQAGQTTSLASAFAFGTLEISAQLHRDGPTLEGVVYALYEDDPDAPLGRREVARSAATAPSFRLPAGNYYIVARKGSVEMRDRVTVRAGEIDRRILVLDAGRLGLSVKLSGGRIEPDGPVTHRIERIDVQPGEVQSVRGLEAGLDLAAGQYRLESRAGFGNVRLVREFRLAAGSTERIAIDHPAALARFRLSERVGAAPMVDASYEVRDRAGLLVWEGLGADAKVLLLAGRYTVKAESRDGAVERAFEVRAGEERQVEIVLK